MELKSIMGKSCIEVPNSKSPKYRKRRAGLAKARVQSPRELQLSEHSL